MKKITFEERLYNTMFYHEPVQESVISKLYSLDHGRMRAKLNKLMLEGRATREYQGNKAIYRTKKGFKRVVSHTLPEIKLKLQTLIEEEPGKNIIYYSDKLTMLGIGKGYDSNQKLIRRMGQKGILDIRKRGVNTLCYPNYHYHTVTSSINNGFTDHTFGRNDNGLTIRSDVTIDSFVRQMAKLQARYPDVKKFKLVPMEG